MNRIYPLGAYDGKVVDSKMAKKIVLQSALGITVQYSVHCRGVSQSASAVRMDGRIDHGPAGGAMGRFRSRRESNKHIHHGGHRGHGEINVGPDASPDHFVLNISAKNAKECQEEHSTNCTPAVFVAGMITNSFVSLCAILFFLFIFYRSSV
jgi:hypothetical protein